MEILDLYGKSHLVANMGTSIYDLLNGGLSDLHLHLRFLGQNLAAEVPVFYVDAVQNDSCELHHISQKEEMRTVMEAIINSAASVLGITIGIQLLMSREAGVWYDREVYKLSLPQEEKIHTYNREQHAEAAAQCTYTPSPSLFYRMFPFHFIIDQECRLLQVGSKLQDIASRMTKGSLVGHTLKIMYPDMEWNYQRLALLSACSFLLSTGSTTSARVGDGNGLMLIGQFFETEMDGAPVLVFMGSPRLTSLEHMRSHGLRLCDIPSHDMARDYLLINDQQRSEEDRIKQLQMERDRMAKEARWIEKEAIWFEKEKNKAEAACERLKESLNQALSKLAEQDLLEIPDKSPSMHYSRIADIDMATPAGKALQLIDKILSGEKVSKHEAMQAHDAILDAGTELFRPQNFGAKLGMTGMDTDVNQALVNMLDISRRNTGWSDANPEELLEKAEAMRERLHMERAESRVSTRRRSTHNGDSLSGLVGPITQSVVAKKAVLLPKKSFGGSPSLRFQESVLRRHSMAGSSSNEDPRERAAASSSASAVLSRGASRGVSRSGLAALVSTVDLGDPRWREAIQTPDSMVPLLMSSLSIAPAGQTDRSISLPGTMNRRVTVKSSSGSSSAETERSTAAESAITHVERASLGIMGRQNHHEVLPRLRPARNSEETGCSASMSIPDGTPTAKAFSNSIPTSSFGKQLESQSSNQFNVRQRPSTGLVSSVQAATESSATMSSAFTPWQSAAVSVVPVGGRVSKLMPSPPEYPSRFQRSISHTRSSHISDLNEGRFNRVRMPPVPRFTNCLSPTRASLEREREGGIQLTGRQHSPTRRDTLSRNQAVSSIVEGEDQAGNQKKGSGKLAVSSTGVASPAVGSSNSASTSASRLNTPGGGTASHAGSGKWTVSALQWFSLMKKTEHMDINGGTWKDESVEVWGALSAMSTASSTAAAGDDEESSNTGVLNLNRVPSDHLANLLANVGEWQFDIFALEEATSGHALSILGFALITRTEAWRRYSMDEDKLARFLMEIENGYTEKYYHCAAHGADVLRSLHVICTAGRIFQDIRCSEIGILAMYLSAVIHDYEHLGLSNDFLIKTQSELAIRYNDRAPMENHHVAASWLLLRQDRFNFMSEMPTKAKEFLRNLVIESVLATDMKQHFSLTSLFSSKVEAMTSAAAAAAVVPAGSPPGTPIQQPHPLTASRLNRSVGFAGSPVSPGGLGVRSGVHTHAAPLKPQNEALNWDEDSKILVMQMALKSADVGNLGSALPVHSRWIEKLEVEMFRQGDQERALGLPISPLMDRNSGKGVTKAQTGFFKFVAMPLYQAMAQAFPGTQPLLAAVKSNHAHWAEHERVEAEGPRTSAPA